MPSPRSKPVATPVNQVPGSRAAHPRPQHLDPERPTTIEPKRQRSPIQAALKPAWQVGLPLLLYAALICARMPDIILNGRFWAEEGAVFFRNAWVLPPLQALFFSFGGYLNLAANAATLAARYLMPIHAAPYLTIAVALAIQLLPPLLILTARDAWLRPLLIRAAACAALLLVPASEEIWLQTLHCQFELALCCAILLALDASDQAWHPLRFAVLLTAPLCGPIAIALLPLFALRTLIERSRGRLIQTCTLAVASLLQLLLFFHPVAGRSYSLHPATLLGIITLRHVEVPFLGLTIAKPLAVALQNQHAAGHMPLYALVTPFVVFLPLLAAALSGRRPHPAFWLLLAAFLLASATYFGAIGGADTLLTVRGGERYVVVPQTLITLSVLAIAATAPRWTSRAASVVLAWLLIAGGIEYPNTWRWIRSGPAWHTELAKFQADQSYKLQSWPGGWTIYLPPEACREIPCTQPRQ